MKAVGLYEYLPITNENSFVDRDVEKPVAAGRDLLVKVEAVSVNPVDTKVRAPKDKKEDVLKILGFDASGTIVEVGDDCTLFQPGDDVYYAGDITRQGSNSEFQLVDERIVAKKPTNLSFAEAAAMPLTSITAYEALFDRMHIQKNAKGKTILIIGGAGGVGSIAIQLAKIVNLTVIATASRIETEAWCRTLGADHIINHHHSLLDQLKEKGIGEVDYILCLNDTDCHFPGMAEAIKPQGTICTIVENEKNLDIQLLKSKSVAFVWEFMFTRPMYQTEDMLKQHELLTEVRDLFEQGKLQHTLTKVLRPVDAQNVRKAHTELEKGKMIGKLVIEGFHKE
ncbi:zinc-binding alcohol dehydrogenase family protein [Bacillus sp. NPDC077027]|uniref:zinc-binding alcohol dehydrogenase family protein n=1 Tax=Bacillus sp. NPDC077027 TaxID=3390548 RepID=UPI003D04C3AE